MLALLAVCGFCLWLIGERADRIHRGRAVNETGLESEAAKRQARFSTLQRLPVSLTVQPRLYRGKPARYWAFMYRERTRQLQQARRALRFIRSYPRYEGHPDERALLCIHGFEGSWGANTGNGFYGGLQMDLGFQRTYGDWALAAFGTADRWPVSVQLAVAIRAKVSGRGFYPWPNTARYCGLI